MGRGHRRVLNLFCRGNLSRGIRGDHPDCNKENTGARLGRKEDGLMTAVTSILPVPRSFPTPDTTIFVRYEGEGWYKGVLSADAKTVTYNDSACSFDPAEDEYVDASPGTSEFLRRHAGSILVRVAQSQIEYIVSDGAVTVETLITMINALLFRSGRPRLPPVEDEHANHILFEAAKMCTNGVLELTTV